MSDVVSLVGCFERLFLPEMRTSPQSCLVVSGSFSGFFSFFSSSFFSFSFFLFVASLLPKGNSFDVGLDVAGRRGQKGD